MRCAPKRRGSGRGKTHACGRARKLQRLAGGQARSIARQDVRWCDDWPRRRVSKTRFALSRDCGMVAFSECKELRKLECARQRELSRETGRRCCDLISSRSRRSQLRFEKKRWMQPSGQKNYFGLYFIRTATACRPSACVKTRGNPYNKRRGARLPRRCSAKMTLIIVCLLFFFPL